VLQSEAVAEDHQDPTWAERAFAVPSGRLRRTLPLAGATARTLTGTADRYALGAPADRRAPADEVREATTA
jgi:hypothetical protein